MLLSEKRCHSLFIRLFTEPDREEVYSQTGQCKTQTADCRLLTADQG